MYERISEAEFSKLMQELHCSEYHNGKLHGYTSPHKKYHFCLRAKGVRVSELVGNYWQTSFRYRKFVYDTKKKPKDQTVRIINSIIIDELIKL